MDDLLRVFLSVKRSLPRDFSGLRLLGKLPRRFTCEFQFRLLETNRVEPVERLVQAVVVSRFLPAQLRRGENRRSRRQYPGINIVTESLHRLPAVKRTLCTVTGVRALYSYSYGPCERSVQFQVDRIHRFPKS